MTKQLELTTIQLESITRRIQRIDLSQHYFKEDKYAHKKDTRIGYCMLASAMLFENITDDEPKTNEWLARLFITLLDYAQNFHMQIPAIGKGVIKEQEALSHIKINPVSYMVYMQHTILQSKFTAFGAQYIGEAIAKCFKIAEHYGFDLFNDVNRELITLSRIKK